MRIYTLLWEGKPTKVAGVHGGRAGRLVNSKGIMEMTVGCRLRKKRGRMAADGSGWKRTDPGRQRCEGSRDGRRTRATARRRQDASRREDKGADTRGRHGEGGGAATSASDAVEGKWGVWVHQTQEMKGKEGTGDLGGPDAKSRRYSSGSGLCPSGVEGFFADELIGQYGASGQNREGSGGRIASGLATTD